MSDAGRKGFATKAQEALTPDSQKTTYDKTKETVTDAYDRVAGAVQPDSNKGFAQSASDKLGSAGRDADRSYESAKTDASKSYNNAQADATKSYNNARADVTKTGNNAHASAKHEGQGIVDQAKELVNQAAEYISGSSTTTTSK